MRAWSWGILGILFWATPSRAVEVVTEGEATCQEYRLTRDLPVYKDPTLFLSTLKEAQSGEAVSGWDSLMAESPLLTKVKGKVRLMRLGPDRQFKNFGLIARLYELTDPRFKVRMEPEPNTSEGKKPRLIERAPLIVPVMFCGPGEAYSDTLGFVLLKDLEEAQRARDEAKKAGLPPSTYPNPIPEWKKKGG